MSAHTPGEWNLDASEDGSLIYIADENYRFGARLDMSPGNCGPNRVGKKKELRDELEANARLIAAAPDLLAKCEKMVAWLDRLAASSEVQARDTRFKSLSDACAADAKNYKKTADDIRATIAKATGRAA